MATNVNDITPRWDNFAVYLPSIQKSFAKAAYKNGDRTRPMPANVGMKDLNFLNPNSKLWHYGYALYSAGQFKINETQADIVTNRDSRTILLGDSGGFQIGKGTLAGFTALKGLTDPDEVCAAWRDAVQLKTWIVNWLENHSNYAMTLDMPLWAQLKGNKGTPFHKCSTEQLIQLTVENLKFIDNHKQGRTKWLNVIQGTSAEDMKLWWDAVKGYRFGGWALAGDTGWRGGTGAVIKQVLMMRDEGAFEPGMDWLHVLGVSQLKWGVLLTAIQRGLREKCNPNLRVSYDSASPNILSGKFQQVAMYPALNNKPDSWVIRAERCPSDKSYVGSSQAFPFPSALGDRLQMQHINIKYDKYSSIYFDDVTQHLLTHHNTWVYVRSLLQANELAFLDKHSAKNFVPPKLLECIGVYEEMLVADKWHKTWKKHEQLFDEVDKLAKTGSVDAGTNDPVVS